MKANRVSCTAVILLTACQTNSARREESAAPAKQAEAAVTGKPQAPVRIEADIAPSSARVRVRFDQAGTNVEVRADGVDGLALLADPVLVKGRTVSAGETATFDVPYAAGPGQSMLAVHVRGAFAAGERTAVRAFLVGKPSAEQIRKGQEGTTKVGGEDVRALPAETQK